ncbi:hypothetical protein [Natrialbaceae archaeon AArc-T1-2]|uniref:hypothetical protein n=1 Tax=Natrialbaceae archaeon AArc-T1-2 TaxID=3053904 RepID=UPI00255AAC85|nr:hypothetical protein [Natrialbaceae archaeon AArc-T1-2]WIV68387.1 hypothetical protein QQ977_06605 [Natrialbaceae archaeon AArc-T1-2]
MVHPFLRAMVVPSLMALFPALWFVNRNVTTAVLWPHLEPTADVIVGAVVLAVLGALVVGVIGAALVRSVVGDRPGSFPARVFVPDDRSLGVLAIWLVVIAGWAAVAMVDVGPFWLEYPFWPIVVVAGLPFLVLAPVAIHSWTAVVIGLVACALWLSALSAVLADALESRELVGERGERLGS